MSKLDMMMKSTKAYLTKHSPKILTGLGIAGMVTTTVLAVRATPKAMQLIEEAELEKGSNAVHVALTPVETVQTVWKCYIPAVVTGGLSVLCLISANTANLRRNAALATAYTLSETALKEYKEKVVSELGEKKAQEIKGAIAKDKLEKAPVQNNEVIMVEKGGNTLCFDAMSGRYFKSDMESLKKAVNELNRQMRYDMYISLNEFYYAIGLDPIEIGDNLGWNIDHGYIEPDFSSQLATDGTPCLVISHTVEPRYEFR